MNAVTQEKVITRPRVLFVDDSRMMRLCARKILGDQFDLLLAESAEEAWTQLKNDEHIQVLFTDLQMPGKSGFDLLDQIRESDRPTLAELPVVLVTGADDDEDLRTHALERGATDFITKPFQESELLARATAHADSGQSRRKLRVLERDHHLDHETGLGNRGYCEQRLTQAISFAARHRQSLTLIHLQLDGLGLLLEDLGEPYAQRALTRIGRTLAQSIRREDSVFRTGKQCFTFMLPATDARGAETLQERFLPDLDDLGLAGHEYSLKVTCDFHIQPIPLEGRIEAVRLLEDGLSRKTRAHEKANRPEASRPQPAQETRPSAPSLEEALQMIERGETEQLRPHLPQLRQQLEPLLALLH